MLAVISDLHYSDGTTGSANVNPDAWDVFFDSMGRKRSRGRDPHGLAVVLAGDTFDLLRSTAWLNGESRPWLKAGLKETALAILRGTIEANAKSLGKLTKRLRSAGGRIIYVIGNHDRLVGTIPGLRDEIMRVLGQVEFCEDEYHNPWHEAAVVHGHRWDPYNFEPSGRVPVGDAVVIELLVRFPQEAAKVLPAGAKLRAELHELDNVSPLADVPAWLIWATHDAGPATLKTLKSVWDSVAGRFLADDFVRAWIKRHDRWLSLTDEADMLKMLLKGTQVLGLGMIASLGRKCRGMAGRFELSAKDFGGRSRYLFSGHTHRPATEALDRERVYFNTGTWRKVWVCTKAGDFTSWKVMSYVLVYGLGSKHRFATWTGELL